MKILTLCRGCSRDILGPFDKGVIMNCWVIEFEEKHNGFRECRIGGCRLRDRYKATVWILSGQYCWVTSHWCLWPGSTRRSTLKLIRFSVSQIKHINLSIPLSHRVIHSEGERQRKKPTRSDQRKKNVWNTMGVCGEDKEKKG